MNTLLNQALILTLIGMGMTFAAIGVLVVGMYAMTAFIKDKDDAADELPEVAPVIEDEPLWWKPTEDQRPLAAAAAVSVALAEQTSSARYVAAAAAVSAALATAPATSHPASSITFDVWNAHVRSQNLARRHAYDARRRRG
ncbi:MAG: OadG family protein [Anaerolineae bacterium]|nr:OadG family protein [Anaerolineae bacterium]